MKVEKYRVLGELIETNKRQFVIPVYQRNYDWRKDNCKTLFDDIVNAVVMNRLHFVGSIVYVDQGEENKIYRYLIIDGQQRITTIFLLLKSLYDVSDDVNLKNEINSMLFNIDRFNNLKLTDQNKIKLKPIKSDNEQFILLMKGEVEAMNKSSNIYSNYEYLKSLIRKTVQGGEVSCEDILAGLKMLTSAVIILDPKEDNPQGVFESINSTGLELSLADLIRNFVLMTDKDQERLFEQYWLKIEQNITPKEMPDFITDYLQFSCKEKVTTQNAYAVFKNAFKTRNYTNERMLQELLHYSKYYKAFLFGDYTNYSDIVNKRLLELRTIDQATIYQFLFHIFDDYEKNDINQETLEKVLTFFFNYLLRRIICGVTSNSLRGLYKTLYNRIFSDVNNKKNYYDSIVQFFMQLNTKDAIPSDTVFKDALLNTDLYNKKNVCKYVLKSIENATEDGKESKEVVDISTLSIEHIMPQTLTEEWKKDLGKDYQRVHEKYLHNLGNLSLTGYNSELGQKSFAEKKEKIKNKNSHIVVLNKDVLDKTVWNESAINKRADRLSNILLNIFKIEKPDKKIRFINEDERRLSIGEDFDASGTKPTSFIFLGGNSKVSSYADLLSQMMQLFYEWDSELFENLARRNYQITQSSRTYITTDNSLLRKPGQIKDTDIYFETNLSANNIISFIRKIMEEYQFDMDELIICFH